MIAVAAISLTATIADAMKQLLSASPQTVKVTFHADAVFRDSTGPFRVKRSRASAPHRREPPGTVPVVAHLLVVSRGYWLSNDSGPNRTIPVHRRTGDALRMKSGHESETTRAGHNVRRVASVQLSAPHVDIRFEKLQVACRFSNPMSNSQMKCPTHVQLDTHLRLRFGVGWVGSSVP